MVSYLLTCRHRLYLCLFGISICPSSLQSYDQYMYRPFRPLPNGKSGVGQTECAAPRLHQQEIQLQAPRSAYASPRRSCSRLCAAHLLDNDSPQRLDRSVPRNPHRARSFADSVTDIEGSRRLCHCIVLLTVLGTQSRHLSVRTSDAVRILITCSIDAMNSVKCLPESA